MGYRSDGTWIIKGRPHNIMSAWTELLLDKPEYHAKPNVIDEGPSELLAMFKVFEHEGWGYIRFGYTGWKWYQGYPSVQFLEAIWDRLKNNGNLCGRRLRIGEDTGDLENEAFDSEQDIDEPLDGYGIQLQAYTQIDDEEPQEGTPLLRTAEV